MVASPVHDGDPADDHEFCQGLLQLVNSLEPSQVATIHFVTWKARERVMDFMSRRYGNVADLRRIEFALYQERPPHSLPGRRSVPHPLSRYPPRNEKAPRTGA
jgi:hypothetical protein